MDPELLRRFLLVARSSVGLGTWLHPPGSGRFFGLGDDLQPAGATLVARLFGVRDLALAQALRHPSPEVRDAALRWGAVMDSVDVVATALAVRRGASTRAAVLVGAGAALFAAVEVAILRAHTVPRTSPGSSSIESKTVTPGPARRSAGMTLPANANGAMPAARAAATP